MTWFGQAATVFGAFVLVLRARSPVEVGAVLVVALLTTALLWRIDHLLARGAVDKPLVLVFLLLFVTLAGTNLLLSARVDEEVGDRERLEASVETGREDVAELEAENEELRRQVDAPPDRPDDRAAEDPPATSTPRSSTTSPPGGGSPAVVQSGSQEVWGGGDPYFDLDAWEEWTSVVDSVDIMVDDGTFSTANGMQMALVAGPTYESCLAAGGWTTYAHLEDVVVGSHFCVQTTEENLALLEVTGVNERLEDQLHFVATVWDGA